MRYALCVLVLSATAACFSGEDKAPVPEKAAIAEAEKTIRGVFKDDYAKPAPADRSALAQKLLSQGVQEQKDFPSKYVLLRDARDLAALAGDALAACNAATEMAKAFSVDLLEEKGTALAKTEPAARTPETAEPLATQYAELADDAIAADKFELAVKALNKANAAAMVARNIPLINLLRAKGQKLAAIQREHSTALAALKTVKEKPDDPAANLAVGKYICFAKEAWEAGLPYLAKGSDSTLKAIAEKELAKPRQGEEQEALADAWSSFGEKQPMPAKAVCFCRARHWYQQAKAKLTAFAQTKVTAKAAQLWDALEKLDPEGKGAAALPTPKLAYKGQEESVSDGKECIRHMLTITNRYDYPDEIFGSSPDLPQMGPRKDTPRIVVDVCEANGRLITAVYPFPDNGYMDGISFSWKKGETPSSQVYVVLHDRKAKRKYKSNLVTIDQPKPKAQQ